MAGVSSTSCISGSSKLVRQGSRKVCKMLTRTYSLEGSNGFEDLRKHIKQGNEFCQQISSILHDRAEAESTYAKVLSKLSQRLNKTVASCVGTLSDAFSLASVEMEAESELHRQLSHSLTDDLAKPMKSLADQQSKSRKPIESRVDKAQKVLGDKRGEELKCKKNCFQNAKEREKAYEAITAARAGKPKNVTEKDIGKLEKRARSVEDSLRKMDKEYLDLCQKAESSRQEWELCIYRACGDLQKIEEERIAQMQDFLNKYNSHMSVQGPKLVRSCDRLGEAVLTIDVTSDVRKVVDSKGTGPHQPEQILPDFFSEDMINSMDKERRRQSLQNYLIYLQSDIERELKGRDGVEKLLEVYKNKPAFADAEAQEDSRQKLHQVNTTISFLEACHYKLSCAMADLDGRGKPSSKFQQHIERTKDKQGQTSSILRLPSAVVTNGFSAEARGSYRGPADGGQVDSTYGYQYDQPDHYGAEISNKRSSVNYTRQSSAKASAPPPPPSTGFRDSVAQDYPDDEFEDLPSPLCQCKAIYDYTAQQYDELTIHAGDIVSVFEKQVDGWWQGELRGSTGIFPATYVEELTTHL